MFGQTLAQIVKSSTKAFIAAKSPVAFFCSKAQTESFLVREMIAGNQQANRDYDTFLESYSKAKEYLAQGEHNEAKQSLAKARFELYKIPVGSAALMKHTLYIQSLLDSIEKHSINQPESKGY